MRLKLVRFLILLFIIFSYVFCLNDSYSDIILANKNKDKDSSNRVISEQKISYKEDEKAEVKENIFANIRIPKIDLNRNLYSVNSKNNNVNKNIEILKDSDMPDKINGNFILAAHNGFSSIAFFHDLHKLDLGDEVFINYGKNDYKYVVSDMYDVPKTGKVSIKRDKNRSTITMITCKDDDKQLVVIGYLI